MVWNLAEIRNFKPLNSFPIIGDLEMKDFKVGDYVYIPAFSNKILRIWHTAVKAKDETPVLYFCAYSEDGEMRMFTTNGKRSLGDLYIVRYFMQQRKIGRH